MPATAGLEKMRRRVRLELDDAVSTWQSGSSGDGHTTVFDLPVTNVTEDSLSVSVAGVSVEEGTDYTVDYEAGRVTFTSPPGNGDPVVFTGSAGKLFSDEEIDIFIEEALLKHNVRRGPEVVLDLDEDPEVAEGESLLPPVERQPVALQAVIEALWTALTSSSYDINVYTPEGMSIPRDQRNRQIRALIADYQLRYDEQATMLNVGLGRIEMMPLRRKSRTTGRLVPLYQPQEFDDRRTPKRIFQELELGPDAPAPDWYTPPGDGD